MRNLKFLLWQLADVFLQNLEVNVKFSARICFPVNNLSPRLEIDGLWLYRFLLYFPEENSSVT